MDEAVKALTLEDLPPGQRELAEIIGLEKYLQLCERFGGDDIYIMKYSELLKPSRNKEILEKFDGFNHRELAKEYDLAVRTIYDLVKPVAHMKKNAPIPGQLCFAENS